MFSTCRLQSCRRHNDSVVVCELELYSQLWEPKTYHIKITTFWLNWTIHHIFLKKCQILKHWQPTYVERHFTWTYTKSIPANKINPLVNFMTVLYVTLQALNFKWLTYVNVLIECEYCIVFGWEELRNVQVSQSVSPQLFNSKNWWQGICPPGIRATQVLKVQNCHRKLFQ